MEIFERVALLQQNVYQYRRKNKSIGFVPTMGNLHEGHLSLVEKAGKDHDIVVVSIFVNRKQFNESSDYSKYPRTWDSDVKKLIKSPANVLFYPSEQEMYPSGMEQSTSVIESTLTDVLCGASRAGHFEGVTTIVNKLLNLVQPDVLYLGEKDYQQYLVIKKMVKDLFMPVDVKSVKTSREDDGLAMSSRNNLLSDNERQTAPMLYRTLVGLAEQYQGQPEQFIEALQQAKQALQNTGFRIDYLECRSSKDLSLCDPQEDCRKPRLFAAAYLGEVRLIDNVGI